MKVVEEPISAKHKMGHLIFTEDVNPKSYASAVLLRQQYQKTDVDYVRLRDWRYYFIVRRHFLRKKRKENGGVWICHYCKKEMSILQVRGKRTSKKFKAVTVDHVTPLAMGGDKLSTANMVECCYKCNQKKGSMPYEKYVMGLN